MFKKIFTVAVASILLANLSGCGQNVNPNHQSEVTDLESSLTIQPMTPRDDIDYDKGQVAVVSKNKVEIHLAGSGSCPPVLERAFIEGDTIQLALKDWGDRICTMDYRPYSQLLSSTSDKIDFNDYDYEVCDVIGNCQKLLKNYDNVLKA